MAVFAIDLKNAFNTRRGGAEKDVPILVGMFRFFNAKPFPLVAVDSANRVFASEHPLLAEQPLKQDRQLALETLRSLFRQFIRTT